MPARNGDKTKTTLTIANANLTDDEIRNAVQAAYDLAEQKAWDIDMILTAIEDGDDLDAANAAYEQLNEMETAAFRVAFADWAEWPEAATLERG